MDCGAQGKCVRVAYEPDDRGSPRITRNVPIPAGTEYTLTYRLLFEQGFEFVKGGKPLPSYFSTASRYRAAKASCFEAVRARRPRSAALCFFGGSDSSWSPTQTVFARYDDFAVTKGAPR